MNNNSINLNYGWERGKINTSTSEKSQQIYNIKQNLNVISKNISYLTSLNKTNKDIFYRIKKQIFNLEVANDRLTVEINSIKNEICTILLNTNLDLKIDLQKKKDLIKQKENEILINGDKHKILSQRLDAISKEIDGIENEINQEIKDKIFYLYMSQLVNFREVSTDITIDDLTIKPEWLREFVNSYLNEDFPKDLLDKVIFLKGDKNTGKHSVVKAIANELNRPIFRIKYDDYFDEEWLYVIFWLITSYLRQQREEKNEQIKQYNKLLRQIKKIKYWTLAKVNIYKIEDWEWNSYTFDIGTKKWKSWCLLKLKGFVDNIKHTIDSIEDSCVLYVDDLDRIIQSSKYEKWELLWPVKMIINDIKSENYDVILVLAGNGLGINHGDFKLWIDRVFQFNWIEENYQRLFEEMLQKKLKKLNIKHNIWNISLNGLDRQYRNVKFLDKLINRVLKNNILNWKVITQEILELELNDLIEWEKSLYDWIWLK